MILAIETATEVCSVAFQDGEGEVFEKHTSGRAVHATRLFTFISELMEEHHFGMADLSAVLVSNGPGSYTGLRIGASAVKGLLFGTEVPLFAASTLAGLAQSQRHSGKLRIHSIIDARRSHVYVQEFTVMKNLVAVTKPQVRAITDFVEGLRNDDVIAGTGTGRFEIPKNISVQICGPECISAVHLISLFREQPHSGFFKKTGLEALNPDYITSNQVNNSAV